MGKTWFKTNRPIRASFSPVGPQTDVIRPEASCVVHPVGIGMESMTSEGNDQTGSDHLHQRDEPDLCPESWSKECLETYEIQMI